MTPPVPPPGGEEDRFPMFQPRRDPAPRTERTSWFPTASARHGSSQERDDPVAYPDSHGADPRDAAPGGTDPRDAGSAGTDPHELRDVRDANPRAGGVAGPGTSVDPLDVRPRHADPRVSAGFASGPYRPGTPRGPGRRVGFRRGCAVAGGPVGGRAVPGGLAADRTVGLSERGRASGPGALRGPAWPRRPDPARGTPTLGPVRAAGQPQQLLRSPGRPTSRQGRGARGGAGRRRRRARPAHAGR